MTIPKAWLEVRSDGVGVITIRNPPVNALDVAVWNGLYLSYHEAYERSDVKAIVVKGADGTFCGGADIREFNNRDGGIHDVVPMNKLVLANDFLEGGPKPSVAAIEGFALGGGLEVAMVCHARIAAPKAALGLPELQLGIIPGFGGTQRLPRLVGASKGIEMMLTSKSISSEEAKDLGLVDDIASPEELVNVACQWALDIAERQRPWQPSLHRVDILGPISEALQAVQEARARCQRTMRNQVSPFKCLDVVEEGLLKGGSAGCLEERKALKELVVTPQSKCLVHAFFAQRSSSKVPGITDKGLRPRRIQRVAVVGGDLMGSGLATSLALAGHHVYLKEISETLLQAAFGRVEANLKKRFQKGGLPGDKLQQTLNLVKGTLDYENFCTVDLVIEAVIEDIPLKQQIFNDLEKYCGPDCVLATSTSQIELDIIGARTNAHNRIVGLHFSSPAHVMPLLEIVRSQNTSVQVVVDMLALAKTIKKVPIVVKSRIGFAVNRVFFPYFKAATFLVDLGVDPYRLDSIIAEFGMPMGPFRLADLTGIMIHAIASRSWSNAFPTRVYSTGLWDALVKANRLGEGVGKGFYNYQNGSRQAKPSSDIRPILRESRELSGRHQGAALTDKGILEMMFFPVVNEACRVLDEGVVIRASDLDIASILGMGFPKYRGGIVFWADLVGPEYIYSQLTEFCNLYGDFFKPCASLERVATGKLRVADILTLPSSRL